MTEPQHEGECCNGCAAEKAYKKQIHPAWVDPHRPCCCKSKLNRCVSCGECIPDCECEVVVL